MKRARSPGAGSLDEMRLMYYSANWQLLEERIDRSWTSGFTEDERAQTFWGKRYIDDAVGRRRDRDANGTWDDSFFYVTDAQFSTVAMAKPNGGIVERTTYDSYGKARHHFGADVTGDGATTSADGAAIQNAYGNSIGDAGYKAELDLDRDGDIDSDDYNAGIALSGGVTQSALAGGMVSFVSTGSGGSTRHGPDNPIAWDGYVFNAETGQYHVRWRWYDPTLGTWLVRDPVGYRRTMHLYIYVGNMPTAKSDPAGLDPPTYDVPFEDPPARIPILDVYEATCSSLIGAETDRLAVFDLAAKQQSARMNELDAGLIKIFVDIQSCIMKNLARCVKVCPQDEDWLVDTARDFMRPYVESLRERADGCAVSNAGWRLFFERLDANAFNVLPWMPDGFALPGTDAFGYALRLEIARQMALNHINVDLRNSLMINGVGSEGMWSCIGRVVSQCEREVLQQLSNFGDILGVFMDEYDVSRIRDRMREEVHRDRINAEQENRP